MVHVDKDPEGAIQKVHDLGFPTCAIYAAQCDPEHAKRLGGALKRHGIEATALETLGPGQNVWDFLRGPATIGLVPAGTRRARIDAMKRGADFAHSLGIPAIQTHVGFIPENPADAAYEPTVAAFREVAAHAKGNGQQFLCAPSPTPGSITPAPDWTRRT